MKSVITHRSRGITNIISEKNMLEFNYHLRIKNVPKTRKQVFHFI